MSFVNFLYSFSMASSVYGGNRVGGTSAGVMLEMERETVDKLSC